MSLPKSVLKEKFQVLHKISEGGMGEVHKVRHKLLNQPFVIKVIRAQHEGDKDLQERFKREAQVASDLKHVNIAGIHDFSFGDDGTAYIVMEYIEGATLKQILQSQGPPSLGLALEIAIQSLKALDFLHGKNYIHRDISPDNLMLTRTPDDEPLVKLIDLGLAKRLGSEGDLTTTGMFLGKVRYSAPEQFDNQGLDHRSDIYSFGVMFYQLLTGHYPIPGKELPQLIKAHLMNPPLAFEQTDPGGRVPQGLREIVLKTLEKDREHRIQSAKELAKLLMPFREAESVRAYDLSKTIFMRQDDLTPALPQPTAKEQLLESIKKGSLPRTREASVARVEAYIKKRELDEATAALVEAERDHGIDENTQELRGQLEELRRREREERMKALIEKARRQMAVNEMEEALTTLQEAHEIDGQNISAQTLLVQVQTTVDRQRAAKPKTHRVWGTAAAAIAILAIFGWFELRSKPEEPVTKTPNVIPTDSSLLTTPIDYRIALGAYNRKDWQTAKTYLLQAIEIDPEEREEEPYLPHFYLGLVYFNFVNNCPQAIKAWDESERQKVIQRTSYYQEMLVSREKCEEEYRIAARRVRENFRATAERSRGLDNPNADVLWRDSPELANRILLFLLERRKLDESLKAAEASEDFGEIIDLEGRVLNLGRSLDNLLADLEPQ